MFGRGLDRDVDVDGVGTRELRAVHAGVGPGLVVEVVVEGVVKATVEELLTVELGGAGDAVDRGEDRVDLLLVGRTFVGGETCFVGRLTNQRLEFDQEVVDLLKTTLGDVDHLLGTFGIADGGVDGGFFSSEAFRGDEAGGVVGSTVDGDTGGKTLERLGHHRLLLAEHPTGEHGGDVGVDAGHDCSERECPHSFGGLERTRLPALKI